MNAEELEALLVAVAGAHQPQHHSGGDGHSSPRESWVTCSCGVLVWSWQQFYEENEDDPEVEFAKHFAAVALEADR